MTWLAWVVLLPLVATIDLNKLNLANRFSDHHHSYDVYDDDDDDDDASDCFHDDDYRDPN